MYGCNGPVSARTTPICAGGVRNGRRATRCGQWRRSAFGRHAQLCTSKLILRPLPNLGAAPFHPEAARGPRTVTDAGAPARMVRTVCPRSDGVWSLAWMRFASPRISWRSFGPLGHSTACAPAEPHGQQGRSPETRCSRVPCAQSGKPMGVAKASHMSGCAIGIVYIDE